MAVIGLGATVDRLKVRSKLGERDGMQQTGAGAVLTTWWRGEIRATVWCANINVVLCMLANTAIK